MENSNDVMNNNNNSNMDGMIDDCKMEQGIEGLWCMLSRTISPHPTYICMIEMFLLFCNYFLYPLALQLLQEFVVVTHNAVDHKTSTCTNLQCCVL